MTEMFTGIVTAIGEISRIEERERALEISIRPMSGEVALDTCKTGDSISVSGVCLTMLDPGESGFRADVSSETLSATSLGNKKEGDHVNLELAMRSGDRFGGHMVSGHVDGPINLLARNKVGDAEQLDFELPSAFARYVSRKGSVCLDGVSLTVNDVTDSSFSVCIIPHTLAVTTLGGLKPGESVNLEVDLIARYLEKLNSGG